eukprot:302604_1
MSAIIEEEKKDKELKHHGGQEWKLLTNFVEDFSVTTNSLSTPQSGIKAIKESIVNIDHYPSLDNEPALTDLATFIWGNNKTEKQIEQLKSTLVLGNGASELDCMWGCSPSRSNINTHYYDHEKAPIDNFGQYNLLWFSLVPFIIGSCLPYKFSIKSIKKC